MDTTHAELIEDLAYDAGERFLPGHAYGFGSWRRVCRAAECLGNHALAQLEDSLDAARECDMAGRFALSLSAAMYEARR